MPPSWGAIGRWVWDSLTAEPDPNDPIEKLQRAWEKVEEADAAMRLYNAVLSYSDTPEEEELYNVRNDQEDC